jgi:hypothetical protein
LPTPAVTRCPCPLLFLGRTFKPSLATLTFALGPGLDLGLGYAVIAIVFFGCVLMPGMLAHRSHSMMTWLS